MEALAKMLPKFLAAPPPPLLSGHLSCGSGPRQPFRQASASTPGSSAQLGPAAPGGRTTAAAAAFRLFSAGSASPQQRRQGLSQKPSGAQQPASSPRLAPNLGPQGSARARLHGTGSLQTLRQTERREGEGAPRFPTRTHGRGARARPPAPLRRRPRPPGVRRTAAPGAGGGRVTLERMSAGSHDSAGHTHFLPHAQPTPPPPRRGPSESTLGRGTGRGGGRGGRGTGSCCQGGGSGDGWERPGSARRAVGCLP